MARIFVTGAGGFVGTRLTTLLAHRAHDVVATTRKLGTVAQQPRVALIATGDIEILPDWMPLLAEVDGVIHLAGRAHVMHRTPDPLGVARRANVTPTLDLFRACQRAKVASFVYVSSVHVLGIETGSTPFTEAHPAAPQDPYAQSKWEAECGLRELAAQSPSTRLIVVRPAVICGAHAKGNFARLVRLVGRDLPLPFGAISALRNFAGLGNLCDLLERCVTLERAGGKTYLAADPETLSLPAVIRTIASALNLKARLLPVPVGLLRTLSAAVGQKKQIEQLSHSLLVDASLARSELGWRNDIPIAEELAAMARVVASR